MSINRVLRKEGITVTETLDTLKVITIARSISSKLCLAFPEHNLIRSDIFASISRLNMYMAHMPDNLEGAKYFYKNNSIYFSENIDPKDIPDIAMHECIHFLQEQINDSGSLISMGLYDMSIGLGINEAAVQLMASEANCKTPCNEKYYNIFLNTISPDFYPLECSLINQISYFTGTYPLYNSVLNSNDVFKNTFIAKSDKKTYFTILNNFDKLIGLENDLNYFIGELQYTDKPRLMKLLNKLIDIKKKEIISLFFETQNIIMNTFFINEFNNIRNLEDIKAFKQRFYDFKDIIGSTDNYEFYNSLYRRMMEKLESKKEHIEKFGEINLFETSSNSLILINNTRTAISFVTTFFRKLKKLFNRDTIAENINQL